MSEERMPVDIVSAMLGVVRGKLEALRIEEKTLLQLQAEITRLSARQTNGGE